MNSGATSRSVPPPDPAVTILAPGFRFHPTDEELVIFYLKRKVRGLSFRVDAIAEVDVYNCEPWDLPCRSRIRSRDLEWYFFSPLDRKYSSRSRTNRITPKGYWKTTGKDRPVRRGAGVIGMKKTLVFHVGRAPRGKRSNWVMHEYRLEGEQSAEAGISHNAYVLCRIFEKSGTGPQNGAQYGAPFLEEEWEGEATGGVLLMPHAGEDESNETMEQNEDLEEQHVNTSEVVGELYSKDYTGLPGDVTISLDDVINDPCLTTNMTECINEPGQQSSATPIDDVEKRPLIDDTQSYSQSNKMDNHMEFNEIKKFVNYPMRNCHDQDVDDVLQETFDINQFFGTMGANTNQSQPCTSEEGNFYVQPNGLNPLADGYPSNQQHQDKIVYDAPSDDFKFRVGNSIELNGPLYLSTNNPYDLDMVDDLLVYFNATDDAIHYDIMGSLGDSERNKSSDQFNSAGQVDDGNCPTSNATVQVTDANIVAGTSSSSASSLACSKPMGKHEEEIQKTDADDKTIGKRLQNMLGSISAPPAFADEYPGGSGMSSAQIAATHSVGSGPFTARFIHLSGYSVSGDTGHWSFQKNQHAVVLSYSMEGSRATKLAAPKLIVTSLVDAVTKVLRGSLYLAFLSALSLTFSYQVIKRIFMAGRKILSIERLLSDRG